MNLKKLTFLMLALLLFIMPVLLLLLQSISSPWRFQSGETFHFQLESFQVLWSAANLLEATLWSIVVGAGVLILNIAVGIAAGKALSTLSFKGKPLLEAFFLSPVLIPVLAVAMGLHLFMIQAGLADTVLGVILIHLVPTIPYSIRIFHNSYAQLGNRMLEQPIVLGAAPLQQLFTVELPLMKPAIRSVTFLTIVISLSQYAITSIIGGGKIVTLPMIFFPFLDTANTSVMAAFAVWFAIIPLAMYIIVEGLILLLPYSRKPWRNTR
ncbi:ABC transporter permease [Halobacillus halophilus]|uniref:ABC-type transport system permease protein n=1 Tax=Halobacillus halophilus (strain ATCC 35676 / DSM 2266 / JCM 20832 / KCTC 3685 / LMG 17431 / NBRC 102448 / NCIMB 2269) TaxID=866895 RepID=I0JHW6_HALH3|nr:ABC transporter permease subunit [Halobacillus halophilus]ASF37937.1 ABC transporter permease [Halobacillus halophilus]CCG43734.1 ABC-type transport system permease protein [Halobacillus halophilus DSM 2266]